MVVPRIVRIVVTCAVVAVVSLTAACSEPGPPASVGVGGGEDASPALTEQMTYDGPEAELPLEYPAPATTDEEVTIGVVCAVCQVPGVALLTEQAQAQAEELGARVIATDAGGDPQKQLNQVRQLIAQGAQAIIVQPLVETAMAPAFEEAEAKGVSVITIGAPGDTTQPLLPGVVSNVTFGLDKAAFAKAQHLASTLPEGAEIGVIGYGVPSDSVKYGVDRTAYWAEQFGLEVVQQSDVTELTATAGQTAATALLQRHPELRAIVSFTDAVSAGALTAARLLNRPDVVVCANDFDKFGYSAVTSVPGSCSVRWDWEGLGSQAAVAAYESANGQSGLPPVVTTDGGQLVTSENVEEVDVVG
jgi:ABC-type sugar transport system substrate-binding protein